MEKRSSYIPALRFHWLTRVYDPLVAVTTRESVFPGAVTELVAHSGATSILDLGCGTGILGEVVRVLRPGGLLVVCDWGKPANPLLRFSFGLVRLLDGFEVTRDNREGWLANIIQTAGLGPVTVRQTITAPLGTLELLSAELA